MVAYYNEINREAAAWLRVLIAEGLIAHGYVDERSIEEVTAADLRGFTQCHFFAGIGGWSLALRIAGVTDNTPCWTGSPPCQPFSVAGRQVGFDDARHLAPSGCGLLSSASLQECLANRLAQQLSPDGLIFYSANWKQRATPAGRQYCQLALSKRPTNATDYFSEPRETWQTPQAFDVGDSRKPRIKKDGNRDPALLESYRYQLSDAEYLIFSKAPEWEQPKLVPWATPIANDAKGSDYSTSNGEKILKLPGQAKLANWPTPSATDHKGGYEGGRIRNGKLSVDRLDVAAQLATWPTPLTVPESDKSRGQLSGSMRQQLEPCRPSTRGQVLNGSGIDVTGSYASMATTGPLNPALSRWLMGYPPEWDDCAVMAMPSSRKSRRISSKVSAEPSTTPAIVKTRIRAYSFEHDGWLALAAKSEKKPC